MPVAKSPAPKPESPKVETEVKTVVKEVVKEVEKVVERKVLVHNPAELTPEEQAKKREPQI